MKTKFNGILTLLLAFMVQFTFAQERVICGVVSDEMGPVADISVVVKGTTKGTVTDFDGKYCIKAKKGDTLVFSHVSYGTVEKVVGDSDTINVKMSENAETLDAVVVTAMGIKREKKEISYQTQKVDNKELMVSQPNNAAQALSGKVAGLNILQTSNGVEGTSKVLLRGMRSLRGDNEALIVIDGSISTKGMFGQLNPNDIKEISVLKGASAAALYGSRAANGALIVTTNKGKKGDKFVVGLNSTLSFETVAYMPEFQTKFGSGWDGNYDPVENTNWGPRFDGTIRRIGPLYVGNVFQAVSYAPIKDNLKDFYETGITSQNTVSLSGGGETGSFYVSFGDQHTSGIIPKDTYKKNTFRVNATKTIGKVDLTATTSYIISDKDVVGSNIGAQDRDLYWFILNTPNNIPLTRYKDWRNDFFASPNGYYNGYYENPYYGIDNNRENDKRDRLTGNVAATWHITDNIDVTGRISANLSSGTGLEFRNAQEYSTADMIANATRPNNVPSYVISDDFMSKQYSTDLIGSGKFDLTEKVSLKTIAGFSSFISNYNRFYQKVNNLSIPGFYHVSNGTPEAPVNRIEKKRTWGMYADLTFGYEDYLYLNMTGRQDYTSTLDPDQNSYFYPSVGLSFVLSNAFPSLAESNINYAKVTVSNATVYNDLDPYDVNETFQHPINFPYGSLNGYSVSNTATASTITKEKIGTTEFGLNIAMFKNRITLDAAYYLTKTDDLITDVSTSSAAGAYRLFTNIGSTEGSGLELSLGLKVFDNTDGFSWNLNTNYTYSSNIYKGTGVPNEADVNIGGSLTTVSIYAVVDEEFPQIKATSYVRDPQGHVVIDPSTGNPKLGELKSLGQTLPKHIIGLTNTFKYKNLSLTGTVDYRTGHVYYSELGDRMEFTGRSVESAEANRQDFVFPNSVYETATDSGVFVENTSIPVTGGRMVFWQNAYNNIKENYVKDASAIKLREIALNYKLPNDYLKKLPISSVSFGVVARNLITWLPKENRYSDPEFNNSSSSNNAIGIGGFQQGPPTKNIGFNLNIQF